MPTYKVIVNPISGRGRGEQSIPEIRRLLDLHGIQYDLVTTERPGHAIALAKQAAQDGFNAVIAAGGDGTANEVLNGLMLAREDGNNHPAMTILCVGRGNDFAYGLGLPVDLEAGCQVIAKNVKKPIDVGWVRGGLYPEGRYFGNGVGVGFDAVVGFEALKLKRLHGFASYIVAALKTIFLYFRAPLVKIEMDSEVITQAALMVSIMNGQRMGGGFMMAPNSQTDDGLFDVCIARQVSRLGIFALIPRFMKGTQGSHPAINFAQTKHILITALKGVLPAHADGETLCTDGDCLEVIIHPSALDIIVP
jgi:diacylglycerol kinase (ATP)